MVKDKQTYVKQFEKLFKKEVLPALKDPIKQVEQMKTKQQSFMDRLKLNEGELDTLRKRLQEVRTESVNDIMSGKNSDEYLPEISKLKNKISLLEEAQTEINGHLLPEIAEQLQKAYKQLQKTANERSGAVADQVRCEVFDIVRDVINRMEGYEDALHSLSTNVLTLPGDHHLDFGNIPYFAQFYAVDLSEQTNCTA